MNTWNDELQRGDAERAEGRGGINRLNCLTDPCTDSIIGCALRVHRVLGPGLLESVYAECLAIELSLAGLPFLREVPLLLHYRDRPVAVQYRLDLVVAASVVVEVKSVERLMPLHRAQLLTYLRLGGYSRGLLINFGMFRLREGIQRVVNGWAAPTETLASQRGDVAQKQVRGG